MSVMDVTACIYVLGLIKVLSCVCLDGWEKHGDRCYFRSPVTVSFEEARCVCANLQATLLQVNSLEESVFLDESMAHTNEPYWLGSTDQRDEAYVWEDGSPVSVLDWHNNQPDNWGGDHCVVYLQDTTIWWPGLMFDKHYALDTSCDFHAHPYCEQPVGGAQSEQWVLKYRGSGVLYPDHVLMELKTDSSVDCYSTCVLNCRCLSFSVCADIRRCFLYDKYASQLGGVKQNVTGCKLYD